MRIVIGGTVAILMALFLAVPAAPAARWFETEGFKKHHGEWSAKFVAAHGKLQAAQAAHKTAAAAIKAEKDKAKRAELHKGAGPARKALWEAEQAWLNLHTAWKKYEVERNTRSWDARTAKINEAISARKGVAKDLVDARIALWKAELAWIEAQRTWRKTESEWHLKRWADRLEKLAKLLSGAK